MEYFIGCGFRYHNRIPLLFHILKLSSAILIELLKLLAIREIRNIYMTITKMNPRKIFKISPLAKINLPES